MNKYKVSCVNYLNSIPYVKGLSSEPYKDQFDLHLDFPAESARKMINGEVDIALVPVAVLPELGEVEILKDYGIACDGKVNTVQIFSHYPIHELETVLLDYQSRTSAMLGQILIRDYWNLDLDCKPAYSSFQKDLIHKTGGLVIGDRAIRLLGDFPYNYDLGETWKSWTNLPFVFAVWVYKSTLPNDIRSTLIECFKYGMTEKNSLIHKYVHLNSENFNVSAYLDEQIIHELDERAFEGLDLFIQKLKEF